MEYKNRFYRDFVSTEDLVPYRISINQTDLYIRASNDIAKQAKGAVIHARRIIEDYISTHKIFGSSLAPLPLDESAPAIIRDMFRVSSLAGVGPMASVAGAIAEYTGVTLLNYTDEVIVENGGDIFIKVNREITVGIFAGESPLSNHLGIKLTPTGKSLGICTSSGTVGPSLSFGNADAATVIASSTSLADAVATSVGNRIKDASSIQKGIDFAKNIPEIDAVLVIIGENMGVWGDVQLVSL